MRTNLTGISLILILCVPALVTQVRLQIERLMVRHAVQERIADGMEEGELVELTFSKQESQTILHWEHAREFEYREQMYDVVRQEERGDSITYWCWWDREETRLKKELCEQLEARADDTPAEQATLDKLLSFLKTVHYPYPGEQPMWWSDHQATAIFVYTFSYSLLANPPPFPPPRA